MEYVKITSGNCSDVNGRIHLETMEEGLSAMTFLNLPDSDTRKNVEQDWLEIADVAGTDAANKNYWDNICEIFSGNVSPDDTMKIVMGSVTDYFKPTGNMTLCTFLTTSSSQGIKWTWSNSESGPFIGAAEDYEYYTLGSYGGSAFGWPFCRV